MAAEEVKRDLQAIRTFLDDLVRSTQHTTTEIEKTRRAIEALGRAGRISGGPNNVVQGLKNIIRTADLTRNEILRLEAATNRYFQRQETINRFAGRRGEGSYVGPGYTPYVPPTDEEIAGAQIDPTYLSRLQAIGTGEIFPPTQARSVRNLSNEFENLGRNIEMTIAHEEAIFEDFERFGEQIPGGGIQRTAEDFERLNESALQLGRPFDELADNRLFVETLPGGQRALENVTKEFGKLNFSLGDIKSVQEDASRGIVRYNASVVDSNGVVRSATVVTDKWGGILRSTQKNFRSFTSAIQRNVLEVVKWAVAVGLVYGSIRRLQELIRQSVEIQGKLADVQIAVSSAALNLNEIFDNAAVISRELGTSLSGVIDGYVLAFRAAGQVEDPTRRSAVATQLLRDSMILAKLSGLEHALALDTLVGALRQTNRPLTDGIELLDKWVAVSKEANVSMATLAESFAITSTAAENVGIDLDKLNGIIAAVAEVTTLSATESGNAVRAFISGFQTDEAEKELARYGISIRNAQGELLSFLEVIETIVARQGAGIISDRDVARISEAIGGGARRGAQVNAFLENYSRVLELSEVSANASGDAQDALSIKLGTVEAAITNLSNAFTELAQTLGTRGGFLDAMSSVLEFVTNLVDALNSLIDILGPSTRAIAAFGAAWLVLGNLGTIRGIGQTMLPTFPEGIGGFIRSSGGVRGAIGTQLATMQAQRQAQAQTLAQQNTISSFLQTSALGQGLTGGGIGLTSALLSGQTEPEQIGASIAGGIAGTLIAGPVGGIVGSLIGQAFVAELRSQPGEIQAAFRSAITGEFDVVEVPEGEEETEAKTQARIDDLLTRAIGVFGSSLGADLRLGQFERRGTFLGGRRVPLEEFVGAGELTDEEAQRQAKKFILEALAGIVSPEEIRDVLGFGSVLGGLLLTAPPELKEEARAWVEKLNQQIADELDSAEPESLLTPATLTRISGIQRAIAPEVRGIAQERLGELREQAVQGIAGVGLKDIRQLREDLTILPNRIAIVYAALGGSEQAAAGIDGIVSPVEDLVDLFLQIDPDIAQPLIDQANEILILQEEINSATAEGGGRGGLGDANLAKLRELVRILQEEVSILTEGVEYRSFEIPTVIEVSEEFRNQMDEVIAEAIAKSDQLAEVLGLSDAQKEKLRDSWQEVVVDINGELMKIGEVPLDFFQDIIRERGLQEQDRDLQVLTPDVPSSMLAEIEARIGFFENLLTTIPGYQLEPETLGIIFSDFVTDVLHGDNLAIQLALRDLIKVNEEQLEGIFNIPEGMTAFIPFTAAMNLPGAREGTGGFDYDALAEAVRPEGERTVETISQEISKIKQAIMEGSISSSAGLAKIEELWREIQSLGGVKLITGTGRAGDEGAPLQQMLPDVINVYVTNDIEIDIPVYIRGDVIQREVRRIFEQDLSQTVSRLGGGSTPNLNYR
jgi:TP901 family phage tail tape measure protein